MAGVGPQQVYEGVEKGGFRLSKAILLSFVFPLASIHSKNYPSPSLEVRLFPFYVLYSVFKQNLTVGYKRFSGVVLFFVAIALPLGCS